MAVPVIDFSKLNGEERAKTLAQIANGCEEWGFFQLINHGISEELLERVKKVSSEFYKLEREENFKNSKTVKLLNDIAEKKSSEKLENVDWEDVITLLDDNEWPENTPSFRETMSEYRSELKKLAVSLTEVMDENLGLPKGYIKKALNDGEGDNAFFGTKVSHYPPCPHPELVNGLRAHTDAGGVILLFQDDKVGGLQMLKDGEWLDVQPLPNAIVINTGDQIEVLSNGRYKSCWHRVLTFTEGTRRSIASFYNPPLKATISPAPQLAEKDNQQVDDTYPKFVFGDYMSVYAEQKFLPKEPRFRAVKAI
ncbi:putative aminocyclopropanecarboxylate oxidase [Medicago truncatula]|uniref:aminocyclopropanecarboxylate oxidase n=1 Tax=Medicago truncatula TaxID=3880 RepID=A0A072V1X2_MEDTR|nr:1-aminocyclopropane-1-carboxylate oxidase 5 [Medicago truncatula]KEH35343.1 1-aminocyclopropane-1-carboxylate oxidase [Medicago truncatula]RHN69480.1 putative aminocyclopropanecarboxylate oxidase [Medicago truncatula]